ncbi:hypothetical protein H5162_11640 [Pseudoalteromonas sp. SR41-8]|uniref:ankyrin repeat domain-containing protein n=1 Tax=Pseudoalteromonas sp. SR41-8 TaxID=2760946 RepID=UPI0015FEF240|nr:ankyrin repeat domain-containing protein [Pseudoalteromonas sp. SR41-8]MBB1310074.1 hypothetical protein [Pseudoalteromonas sp. SR41-8]
MKFKLSLFCIVLLGCSPVGLAPSGIKLESVANRMNEIFEHESFSTAQKAVFDGTACNAVVYEYLGMGIREDIREDLMLKKHSIQTEINLYKANFTLDPDDESFPNTLLVRCKENNCLTSTSTPYHENYDKDWKHHLEDLRLQVNNKKTADELLLLIDAYMAICKSENVSKKEVVKLLISEKKGGDEQLYKAVGLGDIEESKKLLLNGANINYVPNSGEGLLHLAYGNYSMTKFLLKNGINVNQQTVAKGITALHLSMMDESSGLKFAKLYLSYNANPNIKNIYGKSSVDFAKMYKNNASRYLLESSNTNNSKLIRKWNTGSVGNYEFSCKHGRNVYIRAEEYDFSITNYTNGFGYTSTDINDAVKNACNN